jgi:hypothetical protein
MTQLVTALDLTHIADLTGPAEQARDTICNLPARFHELAAEREARPARRVPFAWIHGRTA